MRYFLITFYRSAGGRIDEQVKVAKRVKPVDVASCNIIMDFAHKKVEKCVVEGQRLDTSFEKLCEYYRKVYPGMIDQIEREAPLTLKEKQPK
jgi:hypothetical protein